MISPRRAGCTPEKDHCHSFLGTPPVAIYKKAIILLRLVPIHWFLFAREMLLVILAPNLPPPLLVFVIFSGFSIIDHR